MKITGAEVLRVAQLARLDIDAAAIDTFAEQIGKILEYIDTLGHINTEDVRPTTHAIFMTNAFREDIEKEHLDREKTLANAPEKADGSFVVPKVIV